MSGIRATVLLQIIFQFMVAGQGYETVTLQSIETSTVAKRTDSEVLPAGYVAFPEIGFAYKMSDNQLTYNEAKKVCLAENGQLAVIDSRVKAEKIMNKSTSDVWAWVGLIRFNDTEEWTTVDGKSTNNLPWGDGEPSGDYGCAFLWRSENGLANGDCDNERDYLCEIPLPRN